MRRQWEAGTALNSQQSGRRGASCLYSDAAIHCALTLQAVYHLPLRATGGLLASLFELMQVALPVPDFSTLSRARCREHAVASTLSRARCREHAVASTLSRARCRVAAPA